MKAGWWDAPLAFWDLVKAIRTSTKPQLRINSIIGWHRKQVGRPNTYSQAAAQEDSLVRCSP